MHFYAFHRAFQPPRDRPDGAVAVCGIERVTAAYDQVPGCVGVRGLLWSWLVVRLWVLRVAGVRGLRVCLACCVILCGVGPSQRRGVEGCRM